jgi:K+-transporting ATPase KdpF subunit
MKPRRIRRAILPAQIRASVLETVMEIWSSAKRQKLPIYLFLAMCLNLVVSPLVLAADQQFSHIQAWALGLLGLVTVGLSVYLFFVMFAPERF